jgi:hypothetical protein
MQSWLQSCRHIITVNLAVGVLQARQAGDTAGCHCDDKDCLRYEVNKTVSENLHASIQLSRKPSRFKSNDSPPKHLRSALTQTPPCHACRRYN